MNSVLLQTFLNFIYTDVYLNIDELATQDTLYLFLLPFTLFYIHTSMF